MRLNSFGKFWCAATLGASTLCALSYAHDPAAWSANTTAKTLARKPAKVVLPKEQKPIKMNFAWGECYPGGNPPQPICDTACSHVCPPDCPYPGQWYHTCGSRSNTPRQASVR